MNLWWYWLPLGAGIATTFAYHWNSRWLSRSQLWVELVLCLIPIFNWLVVGFLLLEIYDESNIEKFHD